MFFDFSLEATWLVRLDVTVGAVKAGLHRGLSEAPRDALRKCGKMKPGQAPRPHSSEEFLDAFNARDLNRLLAVMREDVTSEMVGMFAENGRESVGRSGKSILHHTFASSDAWRAEMRDFGGEPIVVLWAESERRQCRPEEFGATRRNSEGVITRVRYYFFCPETLTEVCNELGLAVKTNGYRPTWN